LLQAKM